MDFFLFSFYCLTSFVVYALECNHIYESKKTGGSKRGKFQSVNFPQNYPPNIRCRYQFIARLDEKVVINFEHFNIEGLLPGCNKDYLDVYIEMKFADEALIDAKHLGRFCGHTLDNVPNVILSLYHIVVMDFYSDLNTQKSYNQDNHMGLLGFNGTYKFIPNALYYPGTPKDGVKDSCHFIIDSQHKEGPITSPTYPGIYPSNLNCSYLLIGQKTERIRLLFRYLDLNQQNDECIDDYIMIFDGKSEESPIIGQRFCGEHSKLKIMSTENALLIKFVTGEFIKRSRLESGDEIKTNPKLLQKKGFQVNYKFSSEFIEISKSMKKNHIRGTECDIWIKSSGRSMGTLTSPGYPSRRVPSNKLCTYYLYGIHNHNKMETATLKFEFLNIPSYSNTKCSTGSLTIYSIKLPYVKLDILPESLVLPENPDNVICGTDFKVIKEIICRGPLILLRLNTSNSFSMGIGGFKLTYKFKRDYGIEGKMIEPEVCHFVYNISKAKLGVLNSPFFNRLYPANTTCRYDILGDKNHRIILYFEEFSLSEVGVRRQKYHSLRNTTCEGDYIKIIQKMPNSENDASDFVVTSLLCGSSLPGPVVSDPRSDSISLIFISDNAQSHSGFYAFYEFIPIRDISKKRCGDNIYSQDRGGIITSNEYPKEYEHSLICQWSIKATEKYNRIMIHFYDFVTEGSEQTGCANTIFRIYDGDSFLASSELCGTDSAIPAFISKTNIVYLRFITSPKALQLKGFKLIWSELLQRSPDGTCPGFECLKTKHCISKKLKCDKIPNCGTYIETQGNIVKAVLDESDEDHACPMTTSYNLLHVGLGIIITMLILILLVVYVLFKEHRKQQNRTLSALADGPNDSKSLVDNNVFLMTQINAPVIPIYHQRFNTQLSDIIPYSTHRNSGFNSTRPKPNYSQTLSNHYNYNRHSSRENMHRNSLRRAHSTKHLRYSPDENNILQANNPYKNISSQLAKSQNCNLKLDYKSEFFNVEESNVYPVSTTSDEGTWTKERMQKISIV